MPRETKMQKVEKTVVSQMNRVAVRSIIAGYKTCAEEVLELIEKDATIDDIKDYLIAMRDKTDILEEQDEKNN